MALEEAALAVIVLEVVEGEHIGLGLEVEISGAGRLEAFGEPRRALIGDEEDNCLMSSLVMTDGSNVSPVRRSNSSASSTASFLVCSSLEWSLVGSSEAARLDPRLDLRGGRAGAAASVSVCAVD